MSTSTKVTPVPLSIDGNRSIHEKVEALDRFLCDHYFHESGKMYTLWWFQDGMARPMLDADRGDGEPLAAAAKAGVSDAEWLATENAPWVAGIFMAAQVERFKATGESVARENARRCFLAIKSTLDEAADQGETGLIFKPWGWKFSHGTSPDQYIGVMHGLWRYRDIATDEEIDLIDSWVIAMADWWRKRRYAFHYFGTPWTIIPHHAPAMAWLHHTAYRTGGGDAYAEERDRLLEIAQEWPTWCDRNRRELFVNTGFPKELKGVRWPESHHGLEYDTGRRPYLLPLHEVGEVWLTAACAYDMREELPELAHLLEHVLCRYYNYIQTGLRENRMTLLNCQVDLDRGTWHPYSKPPSDHPQAGVATQICWGDHAGRIPDMAIMAHLACPGLAAGALTLARDMLHRLDDRRLHWMIDPDGKQSTPERRWRLNLLSSDVPIFTSLAYWRAKRHGVEILCKHG